LRQQQQKSVDNEIEDALDDGFMCIDLNVVQQKLQKWRLLFPNVIPYFAMKCNPDKAVCKWLAKFPNVGFDVASFTEIQLARESLYQTEQFIMEGKENRKMPRLVYANPQRAEQDLLQCMSSTTSRDENLWLTVDGVEELQKIDKIRELQQFPINKIGLIVRILVPDHNSTVPLGEKFGIALSEIKRLVETGLKWFQPSNFIGVSFHCGSGCHDPETYLNALDLARQALTLIDSAITTENSQHKCWLIDIGGGFPGWDGMGGDYGRFSNDGNQFDKEQSTGTLSPETTLLIAEAIGPSLQEFVRDGYQVIAEPGRYFVEAAICLASRIYQKMEITEIGSNQITREYKIAHGVEGVFRDVVLCGESFCPIPLQRNTTNGNRSELFPCRVLGPSSNNQDVICDKYQLPKLEIGDWLVFDRMGAYTLSIASRAGRPVIFYVQGGAGND
jgi:ornithine decarboxylase